MGVMFLAHGHIDLIDRDCSPMRSRLMKKVARRKGRAAAGAAVTEQLADLHERDAEQSDHAAVCEEVSPQTQEAILHQSIGAFRAARR